MIKEKVLNIRLSLADYDLIQSAADERLIPVSTFVRSLVITSIKNKFQPLTESFISPSPSPSLDKLSFDARKKLLSWLDICVEQLIYQDATIPQIEQILLTAASDGVVSAAVDVSLSNAPKLKKAENFKLALNS